MKFKLLQAIVVAVVIPHMIFSVIGRHHAAKKEERTEEEAMVSAQAEDSAEPTLQKITVLDGGEVKQMALEAYIQGVILGEMPAEFHEEALKAQAVATRTYTLHKAQRQTKHPGAQVCTDAACCQAFMDINVYISAGGSREDVEKIEKAVAETTGQVLCYDNNLAEATYFSCSGGFTEAAVEVWGADVPYLQAKPSPGEEDARHYYSTTVLSYQEFLRKLGLDHQQNSQITFSDWDYTEGGGIASVRICTEVFTGTQIRNLLALPSTAFSFQSIEDGIVISCHGYGHRVGMSQYGANAMAASGSTYSEILQYYYPGTELITWHEKEFNLIFDKAADI